MSIETFDQIYQRACERKGGAAPLAALLSEPASTAQLASLTDDRVLAAFTKKVFQSGFVWRVIEQKWPAFEEVFFGFDVEKMLLIPDEMYEQKATDKRIVRNLKKVLTIRDNALMLQDIAREQGSFTAFAATYPPEQVTQLWLYLKQHGARLGGNTGPYALRAMGVDTFLLSRDVEGYFRARDVISGGLQSKRNLTAMNNSFAQWQQESGWSLTALSQLVAYSVGDNWRGHDDQ